MRTARSGVFVLFAFLSVSLAFGAGLVGQKRGRPSPLHDLRHGKSAALRLRALRTFEDPYWCVEGLADPDAKVRLAAAQRILEEADKVPVAAVAEARFVLLSAGPGIEVPAGRLARPATESNAPALIALVESGSPDRRAAAQQSLRKVFESDAGRKRIDQLTDRDPGVRAAAATALLLHADRFDAALSHTEEALRHTDRWVRDSTLEYSFAT